MVTVLADQFKARFDGSPDLKHWTHLSDFGPSGAVDGVWECPDLFQITVEGQPELRKWVLKVDALKGTGAEYFIGEFDGTRFINDATDDQILRLDHGNDFYAAQSWSDMPDGRLIWVGWMNNWEYANAIPTSPWRGLFSILRELHLRGFPEGLRLIQKPIEELKELRQLLYYTVDKEIAIVNSQLANLKMDIAVEIQVEFALGTASEFGIKICTGEGEETVIGYDSHLQEMFVDRRHSGDSAFSDKFANVHRAPLTPEQGKISMHIFIDSCSVEVFANYGRIVISDLIFPNTQNLSMEFYARDGDAHMNKLDVWKLDVENKH